MNSNSYEIRRLQLSQLLLSHDHAIGIRTKDNIPPPLFKRLLKQYRPHKLKDLIK